MVANHEREPHLRSGQRRLAGELTAIVHGESAAITAVEASEVLFELGADLSSVSASALEFVSGEIPSTQYSNLDTGIVDLLVKTELSRSRKEAKRAISDGGVYLNGNRLMNADYLPTAGDLLHGKYLLLRRGKKLWHLLVVG